MKSFNLLKTLGAVLAAFVVTGCDVSSQSTAMPEAVESPTLEQARSAVTYTPRFCADTKHWVACEPISVGPQFVYERLAGILATNCGADFACRNQLVRVWATPPSKDASALELQAWLAAQQQVEDFLKSTNKSAETLYESMKIHATDSRIQLDKQQRLIAGGTDRVNQLIKNVEFSLKQKASEYREPAVLELADVKAGIASVDGVVAETHAALAQLIPQVVALADQFAAFKGTESATVDALRSLATQGSSADLQALVEVQLETMQLVQQESSECGALILEAMRLRSLLGGLQQDYAQRLEPHRAFIEQRGLQTGDLVRGELEIVSGIEGYSEVRRRKVLTAVNHLLEGLKQRREALIGLQADAATRQALADAAFLSASQRFLDDVTVRSTQLWQVAPKSTRLKLSFLSAKYDEMESYLQFEPACAPPTPGTRSWRETGCIAMRRDFSRVRTYLTSTLPSTLRLNVSMMRRVGGVPEDLLRDVEAKLAAGQLKAAATVHDAALRVSDGM